jgi:hypothetical protein
MNLFTGNSPYYHLLKYLLFPLKHPVNKLVQHVSERPRTVVSGWRETHYKREFRRTHTTRCVWEMSPYKSVIQYCSSLPSASETHHNSTRCCHVSFVLPEELHYNYTLLYTVLATAPLKFLRLYPVLPASVFGFMYPQFLMFSHETTRWPSRKIPICCCMLMVTETCFLASGDASLVLSFLVLLVEFFVSYLLTTLLRYFCIKSTNRQIS